MAKEMIHRWLAFVLYLSAVLPWIGGFFLQFNDIGWFFRLSGSWLVVGLAAQLLMSYAGGRELWARGFVTGIATLSSILIAYMLAKGSFFAGVIMWLLTILVWLAAIGIAMIRPLQTLISARLLFVGLLVISLSPPLLNGVASLIYTCFAVYVGLAGYLHVRLNRIPRTMSLVLMGTILLVLLCIAGIQNGLFAVIGFIYQHVIVNMFLLLLMPGTYLLRAIGTLPEPKKRDSSRDAEGPLQQKDSQQLQTSPAPDGHHSLIATMETVFVIVGVVVAAYLIYRLIRRWKKSGTDAEPEGIEKEFVPLELNVSSLLLKRGRRLFDAVKSAVFPATPEGKVRRMYRSVLERMIHQRYPIFPATTPSEVKDIVGTEDVELIEAYNRIRYGEKTLSTEELQRAEYSYDRIRRQMKRLDDGGDDFG